MIIDFITRCVLLNPLHTYNEILTIVLKPEKANQHIKKDKIPNTHLMHDIDEQGQDPE